MTPAPRGSARLPFGVSRRESVGRIPVRPNPIVVMEALVPSAVRPVRLAGFLETRGIAQPILGNIDQIGARGSYRISASSTARRRACRPFRGSCRTSRPQGDVARDLVDHNLPDRSEAFTARVLDRCSVDLLRRNETAFGAVGATMVALPDLSR
jgi:hypothetical protein